MRIDAHQHFWDLNRLDYSWMPPGDSILRRNYLPCNLKPILEEHRFDGSVLVQANTAIAETEWLLNLAAENLFVLGAVVWVDLTDPRLPVVLDQLQKHPRFKGVRHPIHDEPETDWMLRPRVLDGLKELAARDIPFDLLLRPVHLALVPRLADAVPDLRMAIDHLAKPRIAAGEIEEWAREMETCGSIPGLYCKLSGMITEADHRTWTARDLEPYVQHVLRIFGPGRLMFGSDWPVCNLAGTWKRVLAAFTQACGPLPQKVRDQILGDTAVAFYRLDTN